MKCAKHLARFRRSFAAFIVTEAATNLTANLTAGEIRHVHVRIGQTFAHGFQSGVEVPAAMPWPCGSGDIWLVCCNTKRRLASRRVPLTTFAKKILQDRSTFFLQNTGCNFAPVIKGRHLKEVHHAPGGSGRRICAAEDHAADSRVHDRACAHCARFFGHIKIAIRQTPITNGRFSLC